MENPVKMPGLQLETLNPSMPSLSPFPSLAPRRRSHLDSASYRTLVRILSHCLDEPVAPPRGPRADQNPKPVAAHLKDPNTPPSTEKDSILAGSGKSNDAILVKLELSKSPACSNPGQAGSANGESEKQQTGDAKAEASTADGELKHGDGTKENDECVHGGNADGGADPPGLIDLQNDIFHPIEEFLNDEGRGCESRDSEDAISGFLDESKSGKSQVQQDRRVSNTSCQDEVCSSSEELLAEEAKEAICGEPATEDCRVGKTLSVDEIIEGIQQEIRACSDAVIGCSGLESPLSLSDDGEVEEGEIPDEVQILEDQKLEEQGPEHDTIAKEEHRDHTLVTYSHINPVDRHFGSRESICRVDRSSLPIHVKVEMGQALCDDSYIEPQMNGTDINGTKAKCQLVPDSLASPGEDPENLATGIKGETSGVQDVEAWMKKKRGPLTEERKAKKKKAKKRKRAEKNREQGVKRLKLLPIVKPKVVKYCNFYMMGRCHQGDLCKFSHDVTPTTKSQPCKYFASDSCLKGEECPFDHQLSKYPCHRYMSNGMCSRNECKFSHQMPITEGSSTSTISKLDSPLLTEKQHKPKITSLVANDPPKNATSSMPFSMNKNLKTNLVKCPKEQPVRVPNGIRFLSFGKGPSDSANKQDKLLLEKHGGTKICNQENGKKMFADGRKNNLISEQNILPVAQSGSKMMSSRALCPAAGNAFASKKSKTTGFISGPVVAPFSGSLQNEVSEASKILDEFLFGAGS